MSTQNKFITKYTECEKDFQFLRLWVNGFFEEEYITEICEWRRATKPWLRKPTFMRKFPILFRIFATKRVIQSQTVIESFHISYCGIMK